MKPIMGSLFEFVFNNINFDNHSFYAHLFCILGHIPFPLISGFFIDKSCLIWQTTSDAVGSCLLYDVTRLRHSILGVSMTSYALALVFAIIVLKFVPPEKIKKESVTTNTGLSKI